VEGRGLGARLDPDLDHPALVEHLASGFARTWQRPPTDAELKGLIDDHVKEEIATREAIAMGLDQDDTIIRRRLRQKLEFLVEDAVDQVPPTDAELQAWLDSHPDVFRAESRVALRQVYVSTERRGASARAEAATLLTRLRAAGLDAQIDAVAPGEWTGPVESPYGLHLVLVPERVAPERVGLADVRPVVERELLAERRKAEFEALYGRLLQKYTVTIEMPKEEKKQAAAAATGGGSR
jgi:hypothetical protein